MIQMVGKAGALTMVEYSSLIDSTNKQIIHKWGKVAFIVAIALILMGVV